MDARMLAWTLLMVAAFVASPVNGGADYIANNLDVTYSIIDNLKTNGNTYEMRIVLKNTGDGFIRSDGGWHLYFTNIRMLKPVQLLINDGTYVSKAGTALGATGLQLYHEKGYLFRITPNSDFQDLGPGQELVVPMEGQYWEVARTDVMPNWYVVVGGVARTISSTSGEDLGFVSKLTTKEQCKRVPWDTYHPYTAEDRYKLYRAKDLGRPPVRLVPAARRQDLTEARTVNLRTGDWSVAYQGTKEEAVAEYLAENLGFQTSRGSPSYSSRYIFLKIDDQLSGVECSKNSETYTLTINHSPETVAIIGASAAGLFYGVQTLLSLVARPDGLPTGTVEDCPRFVYRGMHLDVARNFHGKQTIFKLLDAMAMYKLNVFHFHLSDDEGWRLEIPGLPELTQVGAHRCHDPSGDECLMPQLGSGPSQGTSGSGYYTVQDYQDILKYANHRHIEVIPEFDMPGHAHAAINAMLARYRRLRDSDLVEAKKYLLTDLNDTSQYLSIQMFTDNAINPCLESTYNFVKHVISELQIMHRDVQPLKRFHFGGDEVPKTAWTNSTACEGLDPSGEKTDIKKRFAVEVSRIAAGQGLGVQAWEDGMMYHGAENEPFSQDDFSTEVRVNAWNNIWEWGSGARSHILANAGYKTILSFATNLYFDHPSEPDPEERGIYWASRIIDVDRTFRLMPDSIYDNIELSVMGVPLNKTNVCKDNHCPPLTRKENIIGIQGQLWTETVRTAAQLEQMIFPRLLALAERAWHKASWENLLDDHDRRHNERQKDWEEFLNLVGYHELRRLDKLNIMYHIRPPGAMLADGMLRVRTEFPGLSVRVSSDKDATWCDVNSTTTVKSSGTLRLVARSPDGRRTSRITSLIALEEAVSSAPYRRSAAISTPFLCLFVLIISFL